MKERVEQQLGPVARAIWIMTFHSACGRILRREAERLGYRSNFTIYDSADQVRRRQDVPRGARARPEAVRPARHPLADLEREEPADRPRRVRLARLELLRPDGGRRLLALPAQAVRIERRRLRRHADADRRRAAALPRGARAVGEGVPLRDRRRVPGHEPRAVRPAAAACRRASEPDGGGGPGSVDLRVPRSRHPQHPGVRARLPEHEGDPARAELPLDELDPPGGERRSSRTIASARRRTSGRTSARASRFGSSRPRTSTPRRASSPPRSPR